LGGFKKGGSSWGKKETDREIQRRQWGLAADAGVNGGVVRHLSWFEIQDNKWGEGGENRRKNAGPKKRKTKELNWSSTQAPEPRAWL